MRALGPTWHKNEVRAHPLLTLPTCCCCWLCFTGACSLCPCTTAVSTSHNTHHPRKPVENSGSLPRQRRAPERPYKNTACSVAPPSCAAKTSTVYLHVGVWNLLSEHFWAQDGLHIAANQPVNPCDAPSLFTPVRKLCGFVLLSKSVTVMPDLIYMLKKKNDAISMRYQQCTPCRYATILTTLFACRPHLVATHACPKDCVHARVFA